MGFLSSFNPISSVMNTVSNFATAIATGDIKGAFMAAAQIGMMFMTGGSSALLTGAIQQGIMQFGGQAMAQALGKELVSMMGQELIQKLGTEMGLPQSMIDAAQAAFCKECGDMQGYKSNHLQAGHGFHINKGEAQSSKAFLQHILNGFDASPAQRGNAERAFGELQDATLDMARSFLERQNEEKRGGATGGRNKLMALALALGSVLDTKLDKMSSLANSIQGAEGEDISKKMAQLNVLGQEFSIISNALNTTIKAVGEAASTLARKG